VSRVSAVIPALNEEANLVHVLPYIPDSVDEIILVDGDSTDRTVEVAKMLRPDIRIVHQIGRGKGAALRTGFMAATGDIIVMLDADGSTDPREIPAFVHTLESGADFAKGSRFLPGGGTEDMPLFRQLGNWGFVALVRLLFGGHYTDLCYGYNAFWAYALPHLQLGCDGFEIETIMNIRALRAGLSVVEVPSFEHPRVFGVGHLRTFPDGWRVLKAIFRERAAGQLGGAVYPADCDERVAVSIDHRLVGFRHAPLPGLDLSALLEASRLETSQVAPALAR
jgi:glycosyltransferase involved in cell wall biosynthesis